MANKKNPKDSRTTFKRWYDNNREKFNEERRLKYHSDPDYRQKAKDQSNASRRRAPVAGAPEGHPHTFDEAAELLGISRYGLRNWRRRAYFPEPMRQGQKLYFSDRQVKLLMTLKTFLDDGGGRKPDALEVMKDTIYLNWEV